MSSLWKNTTILGLAALAACSSGGGSDADADAAGAGDGAGVTVDAAPLGPGEAQTESGVVRGTLAGGLITFRGIPYAAPPSGARRFRPPEPAPPWTGVRDASRYGPICPQANDVTPQDEDCLSLNVWAHAEGGPRPVLVWIHGGGFVEGSSALTWYDGAALAREGDVIVVSLNYRLGALGFLATAELAAEQGAAGNWGLADQIAALGWVARNVAAFGGDPARVMIAGESAGGASVCALLASPLAQGLYAAAAVQSGPCTAIARPDVGVFGFPAAHATGATFAEGVGCAGAGSLACLRGASVDDLLLAQVHLPPALPFWFGLTPLMPVIDGRVLDEEPLVAIAGGRGDVPLIVGANDDEATAFLSTFPDDVAQLRAIAEAFYGVTIADQLLAAYDPAVLGGARAAVITLSSDLAFTCQAEALARAAEDGAAAHLYRWSRAIPSGPLATLGATHGVDFWYLFGTLSTIGATPGPDDAALTTTVREAWSALARGDAPAGWPAYTTAAPSVRRLDVAPSVETTWRSGRCETLRSLGLAP